MIRNSFELLLSARKQMIVLALLTLSAAAFSIDCHAQQTFQFVDDEAGVVIATLEVLNLPADELSDLGSLSFSTEGQDIFGFGPSYDSDFDGFEFPESALGVFDGELRSTTIRNTSLRDSDPEFTTISPDPVSSRFTLNFGPANGDGSTYLGYEGRHSTNGGVTRRVFGVWEAVVELGDCNLDGVVNFSDISTFIAVLSTGDFKAQADCDENGEVNFLDISPFIAIITGS